MKKSKERVRGFVVGFLICAMLSTTIMAAANTGGVMREVFYGVNVVVNGVPQNLTGDMTPFVSDGRTFLPVRGIADVLDVPVEWHGATRTVYVGSIPYGVPFWTAVPFFQRSVSGGFLSGQGTVSTHNVTSMGQPFSNAIGIGRAGSGWSDHALNSQYTMLTGTIGRVDGTNTTATSRISVVGDGEILATFDISGTDHPREISVDVTGVLVLRLEFNHFMGTGGTGPNEVFLANAMIE